MEGIKSHKMKPILDVRQSPEWTDFLKTLGWSSQRTSTGISITWRAMPIGAMVKIQKPAFLTKEDLDEIETICKQNKALFIKIEPFKDQDISILQDAGYVYSMFPLTPTLTIYVNLKLTEQELWSNVSHSGKYSINRAKREGAVVDFVRNPDFETLEKYYPVLKCTGDKKHFFVPPIKQIYSQCNAFGENGFIATVHNKEGQVTGAKLYVAHGDRVLYVSGGTTEQGRTDKSGYALLWESILYFKSLGFKILDLEGKDDPRFPSFTKAWGGFSHFKEKYGGEVVEFPYPHVKYLSPVMKLLYKFAGFGV